MIHNHYISIQDISQFYTVEISFLQNLEEEGLIEFEELNSIPSLHENNIDKLEKMIRLYQELGINTEGIDVVLRLLDHMEDLSSRIQSLESRLGIYE